MYQQLRWYPPPPHSPHLRHTLPHSTPKCRHYLELVLHCRHAKRSLCVDDRLEKRDYFLSPFYCDFSSIFCLDFRCLLDCLFAFASGAFSDFILALQQRRDLSFPPSSSCPFAPPTPPHPPHPTPRGNPLPLYRAVSVIAKGARVSHQRPKP